MQSPEAHPTPTESENGDNKVSIPRKKEFYVMSAIALVTLSIAIGYWWRYRIVSDVPVFAPPEWVWLDGDVEVMVFPDSSELLIHRSLAATRDKSRVPDYVIRAGEGAKFEQTAIEQRKYGDDFEWQGYSQEALDEEAGAYTSYFNRKQNERNAARGLTGGSKVVSGASGLHEHYYYRYDPDTETFKAVAASSWSTSHGIITHSDVGHHSKNYEFNSTVLQHNDFFATIRPFLPSGCRTLWIVPTPIVAACSTWSDFPKEIQLDNLVSCRSLQPEIQAEMSPKPYLAVTAMYKDRQTFQGLGVFGPSSPSKAESTRQHFLQFLSLETKTKVNGPVRIPMITGMGGSKPRLGRDLLVDMIWSADGRYVVFVGLTSLAIVDVEKLAAEN